MSQIYKKFQNDIAAIAFLTSAIFVLAALVSFNPADPSFNSTGVGIKATNYCGIVGSFFADILFQGLGLAAWLIPVSLFKVAIANFKGDEFDWKNLRVLWSILLVLTLSTILSTYFPENRIYSQQIYLGGLVGLGLSNALIKVFNFVGVQLILWASFALLVVFYSDRTIEEIIKLGKSTFKKIGLLSAIGNLKESLANLGKKSKPIECKLKKSESKSDNSDMSKAVQLPLIEEEESEEETEEDELELSEEEELTDDDTDLDEEEVEKKAKLARKKFAKIKTPKRVANWKMPKLDLLEDPPASRIKIDNKEIQRKAELLVDKMKQFNVDGQIVGAKPGPAVTMFEYKPNADVKLSKITELADDLSLALSSESLRIIAPIPGRDVVGIETSNTQRETVYHKDLLAEEKFWSDEFKLPIALGRAADGTPKIVDLRKMPHLLVAGTTGSGKSVFTVSAIVGWMLRHSPKTLRLILVDPKQVDLAAFSNVPHLIMPPVVDPKKAVSALRWAVREMEKRYKSLSKFKARNIEEFNEAVQKMTAQELEDHQKINDEFESANKKLDMYYFTPQPYMVVVIEEFADLMAVDKQNVEQLVVRLAQMARAAGMHLFLAMQSPRKEVVTGLIKTNIPGRISFKVASKMDSRIILDEGGAERLLAQGDMLFLSPGLSKPMRHHGPYLKEAEINAVAKFWSDQGEPEFDPIALKALDGFSGGNSEGADSGHESGEEGAEEEYDSRYDEILSWASEQKEVSASLIQRKFRLGYPRAARLIEIFEREGVVGPPNGSKPRQVLINSYKDQ